MAISERHFLDGLPTMRVAHVEGVEVFTPAEKVLIHGEDMPSGAVVDAIADEILIPADGIVVCKSLDVMDHLVEYPILVRPQSSDRV